MRKIAQIIEPIEHGMLMRIIGSTDAVGNGKQHKCADVNPFILFDEATLQKKHVPKFGPHPHHGMAVCTIIKEGSLLNRIPQDDHEGTVIDGPGYVAVNAGRGTVHEEMTASSDRTRLAQIAWLIPKASRKNAAKHLGHGPLKYHSIEGAKSSFAVVAGEARGVKGPVQHETSLNIVHGFMEGNGGSIEVEVDEKDNGAFVFVKSMDEGAETRVETGCSKVIKGKLDSIWST